MVPCITLPPKPRACAAWCHASPCLLNLVHALHGVVHHLASYTLCMRCMVSCITLQRLDSTRCMVPSITLQRLDSTRCMVPSITLTLTPHVKLDSKLNTPQAKLDSRLNSFSAQHNYDELKPMEPLLTPYS
eukprot:1160716-Pelagomonas_calceolata.AAC.5